MALATTFVDMAKNVSTFTRESKQNNSTFYYYFDTPLQSSLFFGNGQTEFMSYLLTVETVVVLLALFSFIVLKFIGKNKSHSETNVNTNRVTSSTIPQARNLFPFRLPFIDGVHTLHSLQKDGIKVLEEWNKKYGNLYEIPLGAISVYVLSDASMVQKVLTSSNPLHINKPRYIYDKIFMDCMKDGLTNSEYQIWSHHRKLLSRAFTYKAQQSYLKFMNLHARNLVNSISLECKKNEINGTSVGGSLEGEQVWNLLYFHAVKIIINLVMGSGRFSDDDMAKFNRNFVSYKNLVIKRLLNPQLHFLPYWYFHPNKKEFDRLSHDCDVFFRTTIQIFRNEYELKKREQAQQQKKKTPHFDNNRQGNGNAEEILEMEKSSDTHDDNVGNKPFRCLIEEMLEREANDKEIYDEVGTFITAGHETTVNALQLLLMHLALNPEQQVRCQEEVDNLFDSNGIPLNGETASSNFDLSMDDLSSLKHLERCILESLRITPTIPMYLRSLDAPLKIDDNLVLRKGTHVAMIPWLIHRDPQHYPNPDKFDPDRFLPENVKSRHSHAFIPFSGGSRNCIGWKIAIMEIKIIMSWILRHFDIYTSDKLEDVKLMFEVTLQPERNYNVILKKRK